MEFILFETYKNNNGEKLICFDLSDNYAYLAPYSINESNIVKINTAKTKVYNVDGLDNDNSITELIYQVKDIELLH